MKKKSVSIILAVVTLCGSMAAALETVAEPEEITAEPPWEIEEIDGISTHMPMNPVYAEPEEETEEPESDDYGIAPLSADDAAAEWDSAFRLTYGDAYSKPYRHSGSSQTVTGASNRLVIEETDLSLPGRNGLDLNLKRKYDSQNYNIMYYPIPSVSSQQVRYKLYSFIRNDTNEVIKIGVQTEDQIYAYLYDDFYIASFDSAEIKTYKSSDGTYIYYYRFDDIYNLISDSGIRISLQKNIEPQTITISGSEFGGIEDYQITGGSCDIYDGWKFVMPDATIHVTSSYYNTANTKVFREFQASFTDINGNVSHFSGSDSVIFDDLQSSNSRLINGTIGKSNRYELYYDDEHTFRDTGRKYNFKATVQGEYTYYFYSPAFEYALANGDPGNRFHTNIIAVEDKYGNFIQYFHENENEYGAVTEIEDTYGRHVYINRTSGGECIVSYTDEESGEEKTITYKEETLACNALDNNSPLKYKDVHLFTVTNQLGEETKYYSRKGQVMNFYSSYNNLDVTEEPFSNDHTVYLASPYIIEKIIYPTEAETEYRYMQLGILDSSKIMKQVYAVAGSKDIVNGTVENDIRYSFTNDLLEITKTEENLSAGSETVSEYNNKHQMKNCIQTPAGNTRPYIQTSYYYDDYGYPNRIIVDNNGSLKTIKRTNKESGKVSEEEILGLRKTVYEYYYDGPVKSAVSYEKEGSDDHYKFKYITTPNSVGNKPEYAQMIDNTQIISQVKYEYMDNGETSAVKTWTNDTNGDGVLDENDDIITAEREYETNAAKNLKLTSSMENILNADGENEGSISNSYWLNMFGNPVSKTDPYGTEAYIEYDDINRPVKYTYANGSVTTVEYNLEKLYTLITTPDGISKKNTYDKLGRLIKVERIYGAISNVLEKYTYDAAGRVKTKAAYTDSNTGTKEEYSYDALSRMTEKKVYSLSSGTPLLYTESYSYSGNDVTVSTTAADGTAAAEVEQIYDAYDRLTQTTSTSDGITITSKYTYDAFDRMISSTNPNGDTTAYEYDCNGNVTKVTDAAGNETLTEYDLAGRVYSVTDAEGNTSYTDYDKLGRVIKSTTPFDSNSEAETKTYYDKNSNVVKTAVKRSNDLYQTEEYKYDVMGNLLGVIANNGETDLVTQYEYDNVNRMTKRITGLSSYSENPQGGSVTTYEYGSNGFLEMEANPLGEELWYLDYDYVGNVKQSLEAYAYRDYTYGPFGLTSAYYHLRGSTKKEYTYNSLGMITGTKNTDIVWGEDQSFTGKPTISTVTSESYTYDGFGRVKTQTSNDGSVQSYTYDNNSNVTAYKLTKDGVTKNSISYGYNKLNQLTSLTKDGIITSYEYDSVGNLTSKMNNKNIGTEYVYNNAGLVTSVKNKVNGTYTNYEVYGYYLNGLKYNESDIGIDMLFTNHYRYDNTGKLIREIENIGGKKLCDSTYTYDLRGNRLSKNDTVSNENTTYTYDLADHLLRADTSVNNTLTSRKLYTYDERGNLTAEQTRVYSSDGLSGSSISMTTGDTKLYSYDRFNRLTKYRSGSTEATYEYTADNLRASKTVNGKKTNFVWSGMNLMYEYGAQTNSYAYDNTGILQSGTDTYLKDGHGNVIAKYNSAGTKLSSTEYDAFGNIISGALSDSFGYCGEYLDSESGLIYLRNRYYDTATGRFISEDPVKSGVNWYSYCGGNPVTLFDPWGLTFVTGVNCFVVGGDYYELPDKYTDTYTTFDTSIINQNDAIVFEDSGDNVNLFAFLNYSGENNQKIIENDFENTGLTYNQIFTQAVQDGWSGYVDYFGSNLRVNSYAIMVTGVNNTEAKKYCIKVNFTNEVSASEADVSMTPYKGEITMYKGMAEDLIYSPAIFRLTAMHEFGHILGLADCYHIGDPNIRTIMNNYYEFANREIKGPLNIDFAAMLRVRSQGKKLWSKMDDEFTKYYKDENWDQIIQK